MFNIKIKEYYIFVPMLVAFFYLGVIFNFLWSEIARFILFQLLFLLLPGYIFSKWLISDDLSPVQRFIFGYPVSMVVIFILSWIGKSLNIKYIESIILIFSILSVYRIIREHGTMKHEEETRSILASSLLYIICIIITFRVFIIPSSPPTPEYPALFYEDSLWNIGATWSYIRGFPLEETGLSGVPFGYHMLKNIFQATVFNYTRIDPFNIHFYLEPIFDCFMTVFIIFYGGIKIAKLSLRKILIFCLGLFFTAPFFVSNFQGTLFANPLSFYFGLSIFVLFVFFITAYLNKERSTDVIYLTILFIYFTGTKAILGIIIPTVLIIIFGLNLLKKHFYYKELLLIFGLSFGILLLKLTMFRTTSHSIYYDYDTTKSLAYLVFKQIYFIKDHLNIIYPVYRFFSSFIRILPDYILYWPVLLFLLLVFRSGIFRKKLNDYKGFVFVFCFFSVTIIMRCVFATTGADCYYAWYAQVVSLLLGLFALDYIFSLKKISYLIIAVLFLFTSISVYVRDLNRWVKRYGALPTNKERIWDERASINFDEFLAMKWLQKNTGIDKIFFSDRRYFAHETRKIDVPRFCGYSALSGRRAFAESTNESPRFREKSIAFSRFNQIDKFLSSSDPTQQQVFLKSIPADYFIQSLRFNKGDFSKINNLRLIYKNGSIKIFEIIK